MRITQSTVWTSGVWGWNWWRIFTIPSVAEAGECGWKESLRKELFSASQATSPLTSCFHQWPPKQGTQQDAEMGGFVSLWGTTALVHCKVRRTRKEGTKVWSGSPAACSAGPLAVFLVQPSSFKSKYITGAFEKGFLLLSFPSAGYVSQYVCAWDCCEGYIYSCQISSIPVIKFQCLRAFISGSWIVMLFWGFLLTSSIYIVGERHVQHLSMS